ncbi:NERD domain-containing protein [Gilvimarinus sp. SDUM040013]|uniref:NERD domain-containing protein n=1 Tax=Gilvimarinus gilvus TaxID=3058038 RepID=A0ABU4S301_9GAMM|nr:NERD domain-containing protein [Gilvimarinus sp. SDUM040013]MDO3384632.1 NERD domain-containing protein [Gilvimarinus sp. SDUM040013]MDX6850218.1 NERD domain-containing protein [Gilvimarinus sp. SDUM040013]
MASFSLYSAALMDSAPAVIEALGSMWWLLAAAVVIVVFSSPWLKGIVGELQVKLIAKLRLPRDIYHAFHNVTLPTVDGSTQIDHIFVSRFGIFVVETKNMKGWIFGAEKQAQWTQKIYRKSYRFQNPLRQNYKHVKALKSALELSSDTIHSVIVFIGNSKFQTPLPANVTHSGGYVSYIKSFNAPVLTDTQVDDALAKLQTGRLQPNRKTTREHVQRLKNRTSASSHILCPRCGNTMILRKAKRGQASGNSFWGCSTYPKCHQTIHIDTKRGRGSTQEPV